MRYKDINSIVHDLTETLDYKNPLNIVSIPKDVKIDLITGKLNVSEKDDVSEILEKKRKWFLRRLDILKGDIDDFSVAKIIISKFKQKVVIVYKGRRFEREKEYYPIFGEKTED